MKNRNPYTTPEITIAEVKTENTTNIKAKSATSGWEILNKNGGIISACGVWINTTGSPTIQDTINTDSLKNLSFNSELDSLYYSTTYYVRAYANNGAGTGYGNEISIRRICWSKSPNPTIEDNKTQVGRGSGSFESDLTGLDKNIYFS